MLLDSLRKINPARAHQIIFSLFLRSEKYHGPPGRLQPRATAAAPFTGALPRIPAPTTPVRPLPGRRRRPPLPPGALPLAATKAHRPSPFSSLVGRIVDGWGWPVRRLDTSAVFRARRRGHLLGARRLWPGSVWEERYSLPRKTTTRPKMTGESAAKVADVGGGERRKSGPVDPHPWLILEFFCGLEFPR